MLMAMVQMSAEELEGVEQAHEMYLISLMAGYACDGWDPLKQSLTRPSM